MKEHAQKNMRYLERQWNDKAFPREMEEKNDTLKGHQGVDDINKRHARHKRKSL